MAYQQLPAKSNGDAWSLALYDIVRENFNQGVPDIFAAKGDIAVASTTDQAVRLAVGSNGAEFTPDTGQPGGLAWQIRPCVNAYGNAATTLAAGTWTTVNLNSERFDTDAMHSAASPNGRVIIPANAAGIYRVSLVCEIAATGARTTGARALLNGATPIAQSVVQTSSSPTQNVVHSAMVDYQLAVGNYIELQAYCDDGSGTATVQAFSPVLCVAWLRRS